MQNLVAVSYAAYTQSQNVGGMGPTMIGDVTDPYIPVCTTMSNLAVERVLRRNGREPPKLGTMGPRPLAVGAYDP